MLSLQNGRPHDYDERLLDITPGSVSIMGLMNDTDGKVHLIIDKDILSEEFFACHPCINTSSIKFMQEDLKEKILPVIKHSAIVVEL